MVWFGRPLLLRSGILLQDYIIFPKPDSLEIGLSPNSSQNTRSYSLNQSVHYLIFSGVPHYYWDVGLLLSSLPKPDFRGRTHSELGYLPIRLKLHGPIPWTNPFTIRSFSGVPHYYWDVGLLLSSLPKPDFRGRTHSELGYLPIRLKIHGSIL